MGARQKIPVDRHIAPLYLSLVANDGGTTYHGETTMSTERPTAEKIAANTPAYGFTFELGALHKKIDGTLVELRAQPILRVVDTAKFEAAFPGVQLKHSNGSSIRVHSQAIGRDAAFKNASVKPESVKLANISQICLGSTSTTVTVAQKMTDDEAAQMVALLVDAGLSATDARAKVEAVRNG